MKQQLGSEPALDILWAIIAKDIDWLLYEKRNRFLSEKKKPSSKMVQWYS